MEEEKPSARTRAWAQARMRSRVQREASVLSNPHMSTNTTKSNHETESEGENGMSANTTESNHEPE
eukprot:7335506-Alexandrium_andersonii.AAC.1